MAPIMTPPQRAQARLIERIDHNDKFIQLKFEYVEPPVVLFQAGQYVSLQVSEHGDRRSYSICSSPEADHGFELLIDVSPNGLGSQYLHNLALGQTVNVLVPLGVFTVPDAPEEKNLIFIGTGSGIAPFRSMIMDQLQNKHDQRPMTLYWGLRHVAQMFWQDEFTELSQNFPNFHFHPVISQPEADWPLCRGRVTDCLSVHEFVPEAGFYLCGNAPMLRDVLAFLGQKQIPEARIHHEKFY